MWVGFDLDGTLAKYDGWQGPTHIGEPIEEIVKLAKDYVDAGREVRIFTARMSAPDENERKEVLDAVANWCEAQGLGRLKATNKKDYEMATCYDDRCLQVVANEGILVQDAYVQLQIAYQESLQKIEGLESTLKQVESTNFNP